MDKPLLSLVTCTLGRKRVLVRLLDSLSVQDDKRFELILVDQNEPGFLDELVAPYAATVRIRRLHTAKGLSLGRNAGLAQVQGSIVGFPDDDCWYRPGTVAEIIGAFEAGPTKDFITGRTLDAQGVPSVSPTLANSAAITRDNYLQCGNSNAIFARFAAVQELGGFDERLGVGAQTPFQSGEEGDLLLRGVAAGMDMRYLPQLSVHHDQVDRGDIASYVGRARKYGPGFGALLRKHGFGIGFVGYRIARTTARGLLSAMTLDFGEARYRFSWAMGIAKGYRTW